MIKTKYSTSTDKTNKNVMNDFMSKQTCLQSNTLGFSQQRKTIDTNKYQKVCIVINPENLLNTEIYMLFSSYLYNISVSHL